MLNQEIVLTLLQTSITGAGLVLAFYALIVPLLRRLFEYKVHTIVDLTQKFMQSAKDIQPNVKELDKLKELAYKISDVQDIPAYLRYGVGFTFLGYIFCILMSYSWVVNYLQTTIDPWLSLTFILTTVVFFVGLIGIKDIHNIMKIEFEDLKKKAEEAKSEIIGIKTYGGTYA